MNAPISLIHSVLPATVDLRVTIPQGHPSTPNLGSERMGSGTIVDPDGYILTVHYVTLGADSITVTLFQGDQLPGTVVAQDPDTGLALVKIPARELPFLRPTPKEEVLSPGHPAFIVASSGEAARRVNGGYITSLEAFDAQWEYMLEKTIRLTAFNPGFGGGTLCDLKGRLLGVVSLNLNEVGKFSLAIPIENFSENEQELKQYGHVKTRPHRPWLGFYPQLLAEHVVIGGVIPGGPADRNGLRPGDIVIRINTKEIRSRPDLYREIWKHKPGDRIFFHILRDEQSLQLEVIGGERLSFYQK